MSQSGRHDDDEPLFKELLELGLLAGEFGRVFVEVLERVARSEFVANLAQFDWQEFKLDWLEFQRRMDELPLKSREAMAKVLQRGWFIGWHDSLEAVFQLIQRVEDADGDEIDQVMIAYYRSRLEFLTDQLEKKFPSRARPIRAASSAHTDIPETGYLLSVPVFIAQADGLLAEITGLHMAMSKASKDAQERYADNPEVINQLYPLIALKDSAFLMSTAARMELAKVKGEFDALNRHLVLHGERSDYGTEINSLKAFSLLAYVGLHLPQFAYNEAPEVSHSGKA